MHTLQNANQLGFEDILTAVMSFTSPAIVHLIGILYVTYLLTETSLWSPRQLSKIRPKDRPGLEST